MAQPETSSNKTPIGFWTNIGRSHVTLGIVLFFPFWNNLIWLRMSLGVLFMGVADTRITRLPRQICASISYVCVVSVRKR